MINGLYGYFGTDGFQAYVKLAELNDAGTWNSLTPYAAAQSDAVVYANASYLCIRDNTNAVPTASTNATLRFKWSPLVLISSLTPAAISNILISGNTTGQTVNINGVFVLAGGSNVTLSQNSNTVSVIGPSPLGGNAQTLGISNLGNTAGTSGVATGPSVALLLAGGNNVTLSQSLSGSSATITISAFNQTLQPIGSQSIGMSNLGNTAGTTGVATGTGVQVVLAGGNNITLSQSLNGSSATISISAFNQSVQPEGTVVFGISNLTQGGSVAGTTGPVSGTGPQLVLAAGSNITLSQSVNGSSATLSIFAQSQSVQPIGTQTAGISNIGNSAGTSGVATGTGIQLVLAGGNNVTLSQSLNGSSATVTISAFNQTVGSQTAGISNIGNSAGTSGVASGGQVQFVLAGGNNITLSQSLNGASATVTVSAFNQSVQPIGTQTAGVSNVGNTVGTSGVATGTGVQLVLAGGNNITLSQSLNGASATITVSAFTQSVESQTAGISNLGNTAGTSGVASGGQVRLVLAGGNNVTLSQSVNGASATVTVSAFNQSVQPIGTQTLGVSNVGNTVGTSGVATGTGVQLVLAGGNNITLSQSLNGASATITISTPTQTVESQTAGISNVGNTAGTSGVASGGQIQFVLAGGNNVTLSQSVNGASATVTVSAFNQTVESQTAGISNLGNTAGTSGVASGGQIRLLLAGGNNVTLSQSVNGASATVTVSAFNQTVESQTAGISNLGNTSGTSGVASGGQIQLLLAGGNNVTLSQSVNGASATVTVSAFNQSVQAIGTQTAGVSNVGNTAGTSGVATGTGIQLVLAGGNNVTLSQSLNGASATVTVSAFNQTVESQTAGISNLGNTAGTSGVASGGQIRLLLAGGNNITLSQSVNGASATVTVSAFNQSVQALGTQTAGVSNVGNTAGTSGVATGTGIQLVLAGGNNITLSQSLNGASATVTVSAFNQSVQALGTQTAGISNLGNSAGTSGVATGTGIQLLLAGGNNVTLSQSVNGASATVTVSAFNQTVESQSIGMNTSTAGGATAGTSGSASGGQVNYNFVAGSNITLSQSVNGASGTLSIFALAEGTQTAGISNLGNTSGTSGVATGTGIQLILAGGNNITLSQSLNGASATVTISALREINELQPIDILTLVTNSTLGQNTLYFTPFDLPFPMLASRLNLFLSVATTLQASNSTNSAGYTISAAIYTRGTGASSERILSLWSGSAFIRMSNSSNTQVAVTIPFGISNSTAVSTTSNAVVSSSNASTYLVNSVGGFRILPLPISSTMSQGRYWLAIANSSTSSNAIGVLQCTVMQQTNAINTLNFTPFGTSSAASNASQAQFLPGIGSYSATSNAFPSSVGLSLTDIRASSVQTIPIFNFSGFAAGTAIL